MKDKFQIQVVSAFIVALLLILLLFAKAANAQKQVKVIVQNISNDGYEQYTTARFGLITWLDKDPEWEQLKTDVYYSANHDAYINIERIHNAHWTSRTLEWRNALKTSDIDSNRLYVYVGHNALLDVFEQDTLTGCYPNMLFGCLTNNWNVDNTIVDCDWYVAPEAYVVLPAIEAWLQGGSNNHVNEVVTMMYAKYQKITTEESSKIFNNIP